MGWKRFATRLWLWCKSRVTAYHGALTKDFNYASDFFFGLDFLMVTAGIRFRSDNVNLQRCWNIYRWLIYCPLPVALWNTYLGVKRGESFVNLLNSMQAILCVVISSVRWALIIWQYEPLMEIKRYLNGKQFGRNLDQSLGIRSAVFYQIRTIVIRAIGCMCAFTVTVPALDISNHHYLKLPFDVRENFPCVQFLVEKSYFIWIFGILMLIVLVYLLFFMILTVLTAEANITALAFSAVLDSTRKRVDLKLQMEPGNSRQFESKTKYYFLKFLQEEVGKCVQQHVDFLAMKNKIKLLLNASFLVIYYLTTLSLASGAIYLSQMTSVTIFSLHTLSYCLWIAFECGSLTRLVDLLTDASESIGWAMYELAWPTELQYDERFQAEYRSVREAMAIVMTVSQQPLGFDCFGLFEFNLERFYELLNMAYSFYTFLRDFV
uniref:Odorant receptor n=1 Tax=Culex quinquefasciatus TaxID=7176 RepID=A0A1S4KIB8_CULQU